MRGLLLNSFYSSIGNIKLFLVIVATVAATVLITGNATAQELFVYITITALSVNAIVSTRKDAVSKWSKFEITLPLRRKEIILCKYTAYLFWVSIGTMIALIVTVAAILIHKNTNLLNGVDHFCSMFALGIGISLLTGALFYPISYLVGIEKSETILIISVLFAIGLAILILMILNRFLFSFALRMTVFIIFYLMAFLFSYGLTLCIYSKKEF